MRYKVIRRLKAIIFVGILAYGITQTTEVNAANMTVGIAEELRLAGQIAESYNVTPISGVAELFNNISFEENTESIQKWGYDNLGIAKVENHLNIRSIPADDGRLVGKLSKDAACEILSFDGKWAHIRSGKVEGYASTEFILMGEMAEKRADEIVSTIAVVTTDSLKIREQPNTDCEVITQVPKGEELEVVDTDTQGWVKVSLDDDNVYVASEFVSIENKLSTAVTMSELLYGEGVSDVRVDLSQYAKQFVGNRYVWGGTSLTKGADCSGFTLSVFKKYGISLPHSSVAQAGYGVKVSPSQAQPGDLFFYAKGGRINHVAIYIGSGQVVHASNPKTGIRVSSAYYRTPYTVRSILPK